MEAATTFAIAGETMDFTLRRILRGTFHTSCLIHRNYSREMSPYQLSFFES